MKSRRRKPMKEPPTLSYDNWMAALKEDYDAMKPVPDGITVSEAAKGWGLPRNAALWRLSELVRAGKWTVVGKKKRANVYRPVSSSNAGASRAATKKAEKRKKR